MGSLSCLATSIIASSEIDHASCVVMERLGNPPAAM